jgi:2-keto-4-pentenoate hydratase/2-oxohepta-3-ene-1,7-dioic acid hydratase in catechol pathway
MAWHMIRYLDRDESRWGRLMGAPPKAPSDVVEAVRLPLDGMPLRDFVAHIDELDQAGSSAAKQKINASQILSPLTSECSLICQGLNYENHAAEAQHKVRGSNLIFAKASSSLTGAYAPVVRPAEVELLDYEVEIGLVLRRPIEGPIQVTEANLGERIAAAVLCNDVSARDVMFGASFMQWFQGKSYRTFCPAGPSLYVLNQEEVSEALKRLEIKLWLNGELRQAATTDQLIFKPAETLSFISTFMGAQAGDLLLTGTPGGVTSPASPKLVEILKTHLLADTLRRDELRKEMAAFRPFLKAGDILTTSLRDLRTNAFVGGQQNTIANA